MKYNKMIISYICLLPSLALAQVESSDLLVVETRPANEVALPQAAVNSNVQNVQVVQQAQQQQYVESLPTTIVEAAPLTESRADRIRKQREAAEMNTEMMIVEQLEQDRINAERERAKRLFGLKNEAEQQHVVPVVQEEQVNIKDEIREIRALLDKKEEVAPVEIAQVYEPKAEGIPEGQKFTMGLNVGVGDYPGVSNVEGQHAIGASFGMQYEYGLILELNYTNSNYNVFSPNYPLNRIDLDQHAISMNVKYRVFNGRFSPVIGGLVSYTKRNYELDFPMGCVYCNNGGWYPNSPQLYSQGYNNNRTGSSTAFDLGMILGADLNVSERFSLGMDLKYTFNLSNQIDNDFRNIYVNNYFGNNGKPVEELEQMILGLNAIFKF